MHNFSYSIRLIDIWPIVSMLIIALTVILITLTRIINTPRRHNFPIVHPHKNAPRKNSFNRPPISHWENESAGNTFKYQKKPFLMTKNELEFYKELSLIANRKHLNVFSKVRIADIIEPRIPRENTNWENAFYKICFKHVDFLLCDAKHNRPLIAIELDDKTHTQTHRDNRDIFVDNAFKSAGIPILHTVSTTGLSEKIDNLTNIKTAIKK